MRKQDFEFLVELIRDNAGWEFDEEQYFIIDKKISNFIREKGYTSVEELVAELKNGNKSLIANVVENMAFSDTSFYRDYDIFCQFEDSILPRIRENNRAGKKIKFWSLGCSTGQETYSIAFAIKRKFIGLDNWDISILGTDISSLAIAKAQHATYNNFEVQMGLSAKMILDFFYQQDNMWKVNDDITKMVEFRRYNMLDKLTITSQYEVIFCRNVLRYFAKDCQQKILTQISKSQPIGGILYLGKNENIAGIEQYYRPLDGVECVYVNKGYSNINTKTDIQKTATTQAIGSMPSFVRPDMFKK